MVHFIDAQLRDEATRFRLTFACPDCASFAPDSGKCSLGYPTGPHSDGSLDARNEVIFCKAFELW
jgi:hypothetical protein